MGAQATTSVRAGRGRKSYQRPERRVCCLLYTSIGEYDITADELLSGAGGNNATKTEQAEKLILDLLADGKELASEDIEKAAADAGISARTVRAAKKNLDGRITSKRIGLTR